MDRPHRADHGGTAGLSSVAQEPPERSLVLDAQEPAAPVDDEVPHTLMGELRDLGLSRDALSAAHELIEAHLDALADDLRTLLDDTVLDPWRRTHHSAEERAALEESLPRLRGLVVQSVMISFQGAVNRVIGKSLRRSA